MSNMHLVLGGPGTGKTTKLLDYVAKAMVGGVLPHEIAFVAFTNAAADEAKQRAAEQFKLAQDALPHFRTIHSMCFKELGMRRDEVIGKTDLQALTEMTGEEFAETADPDAPAVSSTDKKLGSLMLFLDHYARTTGKPLREAYDDHNSTWPWFQQLRFSKAYERYKTDTGKRDFTDMLGQYAAIGQALPIKVAVIDEGQDLTALQWQVVGRAFSGAEQIYVGGDDDQSIHRWAGAAQEHFLHLEATQEVLPESHRLPRVVFDLANKIIGQVHQRYAKQWKPTGKDGTISWYNDPTEVQFNPGTWLVLARNIYKLEALAAHARRAGVTYSVRGTSAVRRKEVLAIQAYEALRAGKRLGYEHASSVLAAMGRRAELVDEEDRDWSATDLHIDTATIWHDALTGISLDRREYYLSCLRRGEKLTDPPRVRLSTIHGAKGQEADHVLLMTDLTWRTNQGYLLDPDAEHRVFYVGATRTRETLHVVMPQTEYGYTMPGLK